MASIATTNVSAAFDILLEAMEEEVGLINRSLAANGEQGNYDEVRTLLDQAERMTGMRRRVADLRNEWADSFSSEEDAEEEDETTIATRRDLGRLQRGLRTPDQAFYLPILQALAAMGGRARSSDVVDRVGDLMQHLLKDVDFESLASDPSMQRWRNTAHWARYELVQEGLLKDDSKRGTWEISEKGRQFLAEKGS